MYKVRVLLCVFLIGVQACRLGAMQSPAEKKESQDRVYIKRGLVDALNASANFFAGRTIKELNDIINVAQDSLNNKDRIAYFKTELNKNDAQINAALNQLIETGRQSLIKKGVQPAQSKSAPAHAQKNTAKLAPQPQVKKQSQANNQPKKQEAKKAQVVQPKSQPQKASNANSNNEPAPKANSNNEPVPAAVEIKDQLWNAAGDGNIELVKLHLAQGTPVNKLSPGNETPVSLASQAGHEEVVDILIQAGADVNKPNLNQHTPLMFAVFNNRPVIARKLIDAGANVDVRDAQGMTPLMEATFDGSIDLVKLLIESGADLEAIDKQGETASSYAKLRGHHEIKKMIDQALIQRRAQNPQSLNAPRAISKDDQIKLALRSVLKEQIAAKDPLWKAAADGNMELVKWHLALGSDINKGNPGNDTPLSLAIGAGHEDIAHLLLENGADIHRKNAVGATALVASLNNKTTAVLQKLIALGADINVRHQSGFTPLTKAIMLDRPEMVEVLLKAGADTHVKDDSGYNARDWTLIAGRKDIGLLLDKYAGAPQKQPYGLPILSINGADFLQLPPERANFANYNFDHAINPNTSLWFAAATGQLELVRKLLFKGVDVNKVGHSNQTPLSYASMNGNNLVIDLLIRAGAAIDLPDNNGETALMFAARLNQIAAVQKLIAAQANLNVQNLEGATALIEAAKKGHIHIAKILIGNGADITIKDYWNQTARQYAQAGGFKDIVEFIDQQMNNENGKIDPSLTQALNKTSIWQEAAKGELVIVLKDLQQGADINAVNSEGKTILMVAAEQGRANVVFNLLQRGPNVNGTDVEGNTALQLAIKHNHHNVVPMLLKAGADIKNKNQDGQSALWIAVQLGNGEIIQQLINAGADLNEQDDDGYTLLMLATYLYRLSQKIITLLYKSGVDVNEQDDFGTTALMIAASRANVKAAQELLDAGASLKIEDITGRTALDYASNDKMREFLEAEIQKRYVHEPKPKIENAKLLTAAKKNDIEVVKMMLKDNVNLEIRNENGATPLGQAARWGTLPIVKLLVEAGAVVDTEDENHMTPLFSAIIKGDYDMTKYLIEQGANVNHRDTFRGRTPLHYVVRMTEGGTAIQKSVKRMSPKVAIDMINLLLLHGADPNIVDNKKLIPYKLATALKLSPLVKVLQKVSLPKIKLSYINTWDSLLSTHSAYDIGAFA